MALHILFWILLFIVVYTYVGYGIVLYGMVRIKRFFRKPFEPTGTVFPEVTMVVAAWNERAFIDAKVNNMRNLNYPKDKLKVLFITDGSDDGSEIILEDYSDVEVLHQDLRQGKTAALNRVMRFVSTPIVIFSDANAMLNADAVKEIVKHYEDPKVGCVAGEKRIADNETDVAAGAGEGIYWKYESALKKWDFELYSCVGAAGELFSVRTELYEHTPTDTLLDDFIISLGIAERGYKIAYEPNAYAVENSSANVKEEMKRKVRICAGGLQSIGRLKGLLNPFKHGVLTFQYLSHRVLRWTGIFTNFRICNQ